ncbi:VOC family protein [Pontibacillus marinus]|uniref:3-demethylubiquinone-9 3-methyltransferase n=1 Tax=Pontibacillus marinus BH030004 = DSM 16465 TaxID=1385511 RepID=A0A0A5FW59_9BACI|nr:VOC family protein [Pontibacillus marinus]KGX84149.1 3-demethylubiquinone-9 3-methyltransferase [Pontibacillus marinus BH030004 = DSM 16465]
MSMQVIPYIVMNGKAKEAIHFYKEALQAEVEFMQTFDEMPEDPNMPKPEDAENRVLHATIQVGKTSIMFSDTFPGQPHEQGSQVTLCIATDTKEQSHQIFDALKQDGHVGMPLQETFFSPAYGVVTDQFGVTFQIYTGSEE